MENNKSNALLPKTYILTKAKKVLALGMLMLSLFFASPNTFLSSSYLTAKVSAQSNPVPPCGDSYGNSTDRSNIESAMLSGTEGDVATAISNAKTTRGNRVGCQETCITYTAANFAEPTLSTIVERWNTVHAPGLAAFTAVCPTIGRAWGPRALGGYYARLASSSADIVKLAEIGNMYEAQQYKTAYEPAPLAAPAGVFGYLHTTSTDPCYPLPISAGGGTDSCGNPVPPGTDPIQALCDAKPSICVTYTAGAFAGRNFLVADTIPEQNIIDGGMAYD